MAHQPDGPSMPLATPDEIRTAFGRSPIPSDGDEDVNRPHATHLNIVQWAPVAVARPVDLILDWLSDQPDLPKAVNTELPFIWPTLDFETDQCLFSQ